MRAAFLDYDTVSNGDLDATALQSAVDELRLFDLNEPAILDQMRGMDIVLLNKLVLNRELLQASASLKLVLVAGTGTNNIDLDAAASEALASVMCGPTAPHRWSNRCGR